MSDKDIASLSFEDAMKELETIVRQLESGGGKLEDTIHNYTRGIALRQHCESKLKDAQLKVDRLTKNEDGTFKTTTEVLK